MPFLAQEPCVGHAGSSTDPSASCCSGYTKWFYDANTGIPYTGFMCWTASCADQGQFAKPYAGVSGPGCCPPLVNVGGKCSVAPVSSPPPSGGGGSPPPSSGGFFDNIDSTTLMMIGGGLLLLLMIGGKKR